MGKKRKRKIDEDSGVDIGMVMTVSLFLILLTFFILLNSIAVIDDHRTRLAIGSLIGAFGGLPGGLSPMETGESILPPSAPMIDEELTLDQLMSYIKKDIPKWPGDIKVESQKDKEIITINKGVLFDGDTFNLKPSIRPILDKLGDIINKGGFPVEIIGYTDDASIRENGAEYNWKMSTLMALTVLKYFIAEDAVSPKRLTAFGFGSRQPIAPNDTRQSRAQNRRVEIVLKYKAPAYIKRIFKKRPSGFFTYKKFDFKIF